MNHNNTSLTNFIAFLNHTKFEIGKVKRLMLEGPDDPKISMVNTFPDIDIESEVEGLLINMEDYILYPRTLNGLKDDVLEEVAENINSPFLKPGKSIYLEEVIAKLSLVHDEISDRLNRVISEEIVIGKEILERYKNEIANTILFQKKSIDRVAQKVNKQYLQLVKTPIQQILPKEITKKEDDSPETIIGKTFIWKNEDKFYSSVTLLHSLCIKYDLISSKIDLTLFSKVFSGEVLSKPLKIPWIVKGKNGQISKRSLIYFINKLEEEQLIEIPQQKGNKQDLMDIIRNVFVDYRGNSLKNLAESLSSVHQSNPDKQKAIDSIISMLLNL